MTTDTCSRCDQWNTRYHIAKRSGGYDRVCAGCLTDAEKRYDEKSRRNLKAWEEWRQPGNGRKIERSET